MIRATVTEHAIAKAAIDLVRCGLPPGDAIEHAIAGERLSDGGRERVAILVTDADAFRGLRESSPAPPRP